MKIEVNEAAAQKAPKYPCVMQVKQGKINAGTLVLFKSPSCGTPIRGVGQHAGTEGEYDTCWAMDQFAPFHGTITITCP